MNGSSYVMASQAYDVAPFLTSLGLGGLIDAVDLKIMNDDEIADYVRGNLIGIKAALKGSDVSQLLWNRYAANPTAAELITLFTKLRDKLNGKGGRRRKTAGRRGGRKSRKGGRKSRKGGRKSRR